MMQDCGQPGFTLAERKRFGNILKVLVTSLNDLFFLYVHFLVNSFMFIGSYKLLINVVYPKPKSPFLSP